MDCRWLIAENEQFMLSSTSTMTVLGTQSFQGVRDTLRLLYAVSGDCHVSFGGGRELLIGDRMMLLRGNLKYRIEQASDDLLLAQVDFSHMECPAHTFSLHQMYTNYPDYRLYCHSEEDILVFHDRFSLIRVTVPTLSTYAAFDPPQRNNFLAMSLGYMMLVIASAAQDKTRQLYLYNKHVRRAIQYMHENYMCNITADDIAAHVGVHTGHLHRLFRMEIGTRVTEYLTKLRIEKAKTLLKRTDISINYIAEIAGISTQQYFSRLFKQHVGMTPQEYRRSYNITCNYEVAQVRYDTHVYSTILLKGGPS